MQTGTGPTRIERHTSSTPLVGAFIPTRPPFVLMFLLSEFQP